MEPETQEGTVSEISSQQASVTHACNTKHDYHRILSIVAIGLLASLAAYLTTSNQVDEWFGDDVSVLQTVPVKQHDTGTNEQQNENGLGIFKDQTYGVTFNYPKVEVGLIQDSANATSGEVALIESVVNGTPQYSHVSTNVEIPKEISTLRSYKYSINPLSTFSFKNVSAGYSYSYNVSTQEITCSSTVNFENGYNPCTERKDVKVGKTNSGLDIYAFETGDGGYADKSYVITIPKKDVVISFSTSKTEYYEGWLSGPKLDNLMQDILKTVE